MNDDNFDQHLAVLNKLRNDPEYAIYWKNWNICQNWINKCDETYLEYQKNVAWQRAQEDLTSLLDSIETTEERDESKDTDPLSAVAEAEGDIVMEETEQLSEFYRISMEHKQQREAERDRQKEEEEKLPKVEYVDAKDVGIHGISSFNIEKKTFRERAKEHLAETEEKYGPHAEKIITLESTMNYKFDELISKFAPPLWPNIPFRFFYVCCTKVYLQYNMGKNIPDISASSITETDAGDESFEDDEMEHVPPIVLAECSGIEESPKINGKKAKPKTPVTPASDPSAVRTSKRARKPTVHYGDIEYDDFFKEFQAKNKRRRTKEENADPENDYDEEEEIERKSLYPASDEGEDDEPPTTSTRKSTVAAAAVKDTPNPKINKNATVNVKLEFEEPDVIPIGHLPKKIHLKPNSQEVDFNSLYASVSSQEKFRNAIASSNNHHLGAPSFNNLPNSYRQHPVQSEYHRQPEAQQAQAQYQQVKARQIQASHQRLPQQRQSDTQRPPRVIVPCSVRSPIEPFYQPQTYKQQQSPQLPSTSRTTYGQTGGSFQLSSSSPSLPQYRDKRIRGQRENENEAVQCPDCNLFLKNMISYTTHRNYVHGSVAKIPCPEYGCSIMSTSMVALIRHMNTCHRYSLRHEQHIFKDEDEYLDWFRKLVEDGSVSFIRSSAVKANEHANGTVSLMFYCNHTGRKHLNNRANTLKSNAICPAYFRMTKHQSGHVSVYAQLRHVGHECIPKFKTIESYPLIRQSMAEIEYAFATFKALAKTAIPVDYPMEQNSLITSCLETLNNIKVDFERAKTLIDGVIPGKKSDDEVYPPFLDLEF
uniref:C2H2-type domain-containing protein n=1 Tax=Panagrolaimus sp. PS1159 TaxID=55785 RepID=A0AC35G739_9BILA